METNNKQHKPYKRIYPPSSESGRIVIVLGPELYNMVKIYSRSVALSKGSVIRRALYGFFELSNEEIAGINLDRTLNTKH